MQPLRIAIFGAGRYAENRIIPAIAAHPELEVVGIQRRNVTELERIAKRYSIPTYTTDIEALLKEATCDAVWICSPNHVHVEQALAAIQAGIHCIVEKPFTITVAEAEAVCRAAEQAGVVLTVGCYGRFSPAVRMLAKRRASLGELRHIAMSLTMPLKGLLEGGDYRTSWYSEENMPGLGVVYDAAPHLLDLLLYLYPTDWRVVESSIETSERGVGAGPSYPLHATVQLENGARQTASLYVSHDSVFHSSLEIIGTQASAQARHFLARRPGQMVCISDGDAEELCVLPENTIQQDMLSALAAAINGSPSIAATGREALAVQQLLCQIGESFP